MKALVTIVAALACSPVRAGDWQRLPSLPDAEGLAGAFAGVSHGALLVAGGANFPDKKPWEGGKKVWYDTVFVLETPTGEWKAAGKLPRPLGYGVSVSQGGGVVCVGGSDADKHHAEAFKLEWKQGKLTTTPLPALPMAVANGCGALVGDVLYIAGGQEATDSKSTLKKVWTIDLAASAPKWTPIDDAPGDGRMLATAASFDGAFWLFGGVDLALGKTGMVERRYLKDAYCHRPGQGWTRVADLPRAVAAAPTPGPTDARGVFLLGGDDGRQAGTAPDKHRGFSKTVIHYDAKAAKWAEAGELPAPRVTVPVVTWNGTWVLLSGEMRPGVRSPEVWAWSSGPKE